MVTATVVGVPKRVKRLRMAARTSCDARHNDGCKVSGAGALEAVIASDRQRATRVLAVTPTVDNFAIPTHCGQLARQLVSLLPSQMYCAVLEYGVDIAQWRIDVFRPVVAKEPSALYGASCAFVERVPTNEPAAIGRMSECQVVAQHRRATVVINPASLNIHNA